MELRNSQRRKAQPRAWPGPSREGWGGVGGESRGKLPERQRRELVWRGVGPFKQRVNHPCNDTDSSNRVARESCAVSLAIGDGQHAGGRLLSTTSPGENIGREGRVQVWRKSYDFRDPCGAETLPTETIIGSQPYLAFVTEHPEQPLNSCVVFPIGTAWSGIAFVGAYASRFSSVGWQYPLPGNASARARESA